MTNQEYRKIADLRTSFTKDEIVAKMLGWLRGPIFPKNIEITQAYFTEEQLIDLTQLEVSLEEHLSQLLEAAYEDYSKCGDNVPYDISISKEEEIERIDALIEKAFGYAAAFSHQLMLGMGSMLVKDESMSKHSEEDYYTISSADKWTQSKFGISIKNFVVPIEELKEDGRVVARKDGIDGLGEVSANSLYLTFALLLEAYIEAVPEYKEKLKKLKDRGEHWQTADEEEASKKARLNVSVLGEYLSLRSRISGSRKICNGQGKESIKGTIEKAMAYKDKVWVMRKTPRGLT